MTKFIEVETRFLSQKRIVNVALIKHISCDSKGRACICMQDGKKYYPATFGSKLDSYDELKNELDAFSLHDISFSEWLELDEQIQKAEQAQQAEDAKLLQELAEAERALETLNAEDDKPDDYRDKEPVSLWEALGCPLKEETEAEEPTKDWFDIEQAKKDALKLPVEDIEFSVRTFNCLSHAGINTLGEIVNKTPSELKSIRGFGKVCYREVVNVLKDWGFQLKPETGEAYA